MAEQVEITNVGNNGVASEATLKLLLAAMDKMSKAAGVDSKTVKKNVENLQAEARARRTATDKLKTNTKSVKENTDAVEASTSAFSKFNNFILSSLSSVIGTLTASAFKLTQEFSSGSTSLTDFSRHIPVIGTTLSVFTSYLDESLASFRTMSQVGAGFNNSLTLMRMSAAESMMTLDDFTKIVTGNAETLRLLGNSVTTGTQRFATLARQMKTSPFYDSLKNIGFTIEEVDQGLINYIALQSKLGTLQNRSNTSLITGSQNYLAELDKLSKVTGKSRKELEEQLQQSYQKLK